MRDGDCVLLPLDSAGGFGSQVVEDPVDSLHLVGDPVGDFFKDVIGNGLDGSSHGVDGVDRPDDGRPLIGTGMVPDSDGPEVGYYREILPDFSFQTGNFKFFSKDSVRFPNRFQPVSGNGSPGPGKG